MAESEKKTVLTEVRKKNIEIFYYSFELFQLNPPPDYIDHRIKIWEELKTKYNDYVASQPQVDIIITLPDGKTVSGKAWKTTPNEIAMGIRYIYLISYDFLNKIFLLTN
jgi:threonyl-tRNA synthetase